MDAGLFDFRWHVSGAGYRWIHAKWDGTRTMRVLVERAPRADMIGRDRAYDPSTVAGRALFRVFADVPPTEEGILAFAGTYGRLGGRAETSLYPSLESADAEPSLCPSPEFADDELGKWTLDEPLLRDCPFPSEAPKGEPVTAWLIQICYMKEALTLWDMAMQADIEGLSRHVKWEKAGGVRICEVADLHPEKAFSRGSLWPNNTVEIPASISARFRRGDLIEPALVYAQVVVNQCLEGLVSPQLRWDIQRARMDLRIVPSSLLGALWLQLAQAIAGKKQYRHCQECSSWYELDPDVARTNRLFCSNACRSKAYRGRIAAARRLHGEGLPIEEIACQLDSDPKTVRGWVDSSQERSERRQRT